MNSRPPAVPNGSRLIMSATHFPDDDIDESKAVVSVEVGTPPFSS